MNTDEHAAKHTISKIRSFRKQELSASDLAQGILQGDIASLSRGITLVESTGEQHTEIAQALIANCLPHSGNSIRIGITGVPGVGKSTFIESLGRLLVQQGKKVAVLAVDPSSSITKGSILGDKTRMEELSKNKNAFIRPSPAGHALGGVARTTRETIILCEAAGFDILLVETVGVGQSEVAVHSMVDFFLLLQLAGAGDELQGIKRGIIEMADALVINKADGENRRQAQLAQAAFKRALHFYPPKKNGWTPPVLTCSALEKTGIVEIWEMIQTLLDRSQVTGSFKTNRKEQNKYWLAQSIEDQLKHGFYENLEIKSLLAEMVDLVEQEKITPFRAAEKLLARYRQPDA